MVLRTAVIGAGVVATNGHLPNLNRNPRVDLVAVCDMNQSRADSAAREHEIRAYYDVEELLENEHLDWVHICTPVQTHVEIATTVINAGIPVLIQKPITLTVDELDQLAALSEENDVLLTPVHNQVFNPTVREVSERISDGEIGEIRGIDTIYTAEGVPDETPRGDWVFDLPGGELEEGLPHPLYLTLLFGGFPRDEKSIGVVKRAVREYPAGIEYDGAQVQYITEGNSLCSIKVLAETPENQRVFVHGTKKSLLIDILSMTVIERSTNSAGRDPKNLAFNAVNDSTRIIGSLAKNAMNFGKEIYDNKFDSHREDAMGAHYYLFNETAKAIEEGKGSPVSIEQARWTIRLMEQIRDA
ncbi:Gfo/Idh/MocA family protein [Halorientalis litorea]|uniref:Gfo/Idh/MocA family protein n=1 Tax=Halorientalis litorea TaxID=2931977 RepID=UPI001FF2AAD5|nr:Gfo/Idh/MocA family oxidoreductase [Halorientalis litorea]